MDVFHSSPPKLFSIEMVKCIKVNGFFSFRGGSDEFYDLIEVKNENIFIWITPGKTKHK
jgi:hypothetical protein